jgi:NAD(P)-dependent dehydrogenase (short-subunit alcohol dehydrogenase family)
LVHDIEGAGGQAVALPADVTDEQSVRAATDLLHTQFGHIDVLIANAGIGETVAAADLRADSFAKVINVNLLGAVNCVAAVLPEMLKLGSGQLVAISSLAAYRGLPKSGAYCASKAALSSFFETLRLDLQKTGVNVTIIHPGFIKTQLTAGRQARLPFLMELDEAVARIVYAIEMRRKSYAFPWPLAAIVRLGMIMPNALYDRIATRNSFRE